MPHRAVKYTVGRSHGFTSAAAMLSLELSHEKLYSRAIFIVDVI